MLNLSEATIARALRILAQPQHALSFSAAMWPDRETDPAASRSRASHALFGELIRRGLVRRLGSGSPHDAFIAERNGANGHGDAWGPDVGLCAQPVEGVVYDPVSFGGLHINGVLIPEDGPTRDGMQLCLENTVKGGRDSLLLPYDATQTWIPATGLAIRFDQAAHGLWAMRQRELRLAQMRRELGIEQPLSRA